MVTKRNEKLPRINSQIRVKFSHSKNPFDPSKIEWDRIPTDPVQEKGDRAMIGFFGFFRGSVNRGSDRGSDFLE